MNNELGLEGPEDEEVELRSAFDMSFDEGECDVCGRLRSLDVACEGCGAPAETDRGPLLARRAVVDPVLEAFRSDIPAGTARPLEITEWVGLHNEWLVEFLDGLNDFVNTGAISRVDAACGALRQLRADAAASPRYRPDLAGWKAFDAGLDGMHGLAVDCLEALRADTLADADRLAGAAQGDLTAAQDGVARWAELRAEWFGAEDDSDDDLVWAGASRALRLLGAEHGGIIAVEESGQHLFERVTGEPSCPSGFGLALRVAEVNADAVLDIDRFWRCTGLAYRRLASTKSKGQAAIGSVAGAAVWVSDMRGVQEQIIEAIRDLPDLTKATEKSLARAAVRLGHLNAERAAKYLIATLLAAYRGRDYTELRKKDLGALLSEARDVGLGSLLLGIDAAMRHGDAHGEFAVEADGVRFTADRREYDFLTWPELVDRVIAGIESTSAMFTAVLCAVAGTAVEDDLVDLEDLFGPDQQLRLAAAADGWTDLTVGDDPVELVVTGARPQRVTLSSVGVIATFALADAASLTVDAGSPEGRDVFSGPLEPMRAFRSQAAGPDKEAWFLDVCRTWTLNGRCIADDAAFRKVVAVNVMRAAVSDSTPIGERTLLLGPWLEAAKRARDRELANAVTDLAWGIRLISNGTTPEATYERAVHRLTDYGKQAVDWPLSA
jgi:hypothetical protein